METKGYREFIDSLDIAITLGLKAKLKKDSDTVDIGFSQFDGLIVYADCYQIELSRGNSSWAMCKVYTRDAAEKIKELIEPNLFTNQDVVIKEQPEFFNID